jgi:UDP-N-acetylmuramate dehydrogenase
VIDTDEQAPDTAFERKTKFSAKSRSTNLPNKQPSTCNTAISEMSSFHWEENVSLQRYNTFNIPVTTRYLVRIQNAALSKLVQSPLFQGHCHVILGGGSNLLFTGKTYYGIVLKNEIMGIEILYQDDMHTALTVGGGVTWSSLVDYCLTHRLGGIENLSLIPGTVGAAPIQNIGAYGVELSDVLESVEIVDLTDGKTRTMTRAECMFAYRDSIFKRLKDVLISTVTIKLTNDPHHRLNTAYGSIQQVMSEQDSLTPTISTVSEAVCLLRRRKLPDPRELGNAGSFFQNVTVDDCTCMSLKAQYPTIPVFTKAEGRSIVPAAWFIEKCGWKGRRIGRVGVHHNHALIIVNFGEADGDEVKVISDRIVEDVNRQFGVHLVPEVNIIR